MECDDCAAECDAHDASELVVCCDVFIFVDGVGSFDEEEESCRECEIVNNGRIKVGAGRQDSVGRKLHVCCGEYGCSADNDCKECCFVDGFHEVASVAVMIRTAMLLKITMTMSAMRQYKMVLLMTFCPMA